MTKTNKNDLDRDEIKTFFKKSARKREYDRQKEEEEDDDDNQKKTEWETTRDEIKRARARQG